jgi:hypothetical protein
MHDLAKDTALSDYQIKTKSTHSKSSSVLFLNYAALRDYFDVDKFAQGIRAFAGDLKLQPWL